MSFRISGFRNARNVAASSISTVLLIFQGNSANMPQIYLWPKRQFSKQIQRKDLLPALEGEAQLSTQKIRPLVSRDPFHSKKRCKKYFPEGCFFFACTEPLGRSINTILANFLRYSPIFLTDFWLAPTEWGIGFLETLFTVYYEVVTIIFEGKSLERNGVSKITNSIKNSGKFCWFFSQLKWYW